jgi:murein L,D-transpeptidase YcbB/YkuD
MPGVVWAKFDAAISACGRAVRWAAAMPRLSLAVCGLLSAALVAVAIHTPVRGLSRFNPWASQRPPVADLAEPDRAVARALRDQVGAELGHLIDHPGTRAAVRRFYRDRRFAPLWIDGGRENKRAKSAAAHLREAAADGLDPKAYPTLPFRSGDEPRALAAAELRLTYSILRYAIDARGGRIDLVRADESIGHDANVMRSVDVLPLLAQTPDPALLLSSFQPPHDGYQQLKAKLAELRAGAFEANRVIDARRNPPLTRPADILIANLERWRWLPRELGDAHVIVNIPDFSLRLMRDGAQQFDAKVVVGRPSWRTPIMSADMTSITVNPVWNVPQTIVEREYLPALRRDPAFAERLRLEVIERGDGSMHMYQPPSDVNALGRLRFNFPNEFVVYQHDTPEVFLFDRPVRAYSHGCMRVQDAAGYAEALLAIARPGEAFTRGRLVSMHGDRELDIEFETPVSLHITYQTAFVDEKGRLVLRDDIYGHDLRFIRALRGGGQTVASAGSRVH